MDSPGSDNERLRQEREAALSKKMKILIIMLSLVLMILLFPLASNHGLPLLRPMGTSLLQRLWDAMRFIAMTAAISVGIISTSNANKNSKNLDSSSHYRSSSSFRRRSVAPIASTSREAINPDLAKYSPNNTVRSDSFSRHAQQMPEVENGYDNEKCQGTQMNSTQRYKGKEVTNELPFSANFHSETYFNNANNHLASVQSQFGSFEEADYEDVMNRSVKLSMVNSSRRQWSAGDAWFLSARIDEEVEEESTGRARYEFPTTRFHGGESSISRANLQKSSLASHGKEENDKENKPADKVLTNVYNAMMDDNYTELRMRKTTVSRLAEDYQDEKGKGHRRSSSADRRRPMYVYDQKSPDHPGLKQILMEMSKERAIKSKMSDPTTSRDQGNQRVRERPTPAHIQLSSIPGTSAVKKTMQANVQHHQASLVSTEKLPLDSTAIEKQTDAKIIGKNHTQQEAAKMGSTENFESKADAEKMFSYQRKHAKEADHSIIRPIQKHVNAAKLSNTLHNVYQEGDSKAKMSSPRKQVDGKMRSTQTQLVNAEDFDELLQMQNAAKMSLKGANMLRHHGSGEGSQPHFEKDNVSSTSRLLKQSSQHSRSALNLEQLGQADSRQQTIPPSSSARRRKSISYDFGDGFNPDWLMELEPPPPPVLLGGSKVDDQQSTDLARDTDSSTLVQSLVPWRCSAPIDISAYPRAASPLEALSSGATGPSPGEVNRRADEFISNFTTRLIRQRQESLERQNKKHFG